MNKQLLECIDAFGLIHTSGEKILIDDKPAATFLGEILEECDCTNIEAAEAITYIATLNDRLI